MVYIGLLYLQTCLYVKCSPCEEIPAASASELWPSKCLSYMILVARLMAHDIRKYVSGCKEYAMAKKITDECENRKLSFHVEHNQKIILKRSLFTEALFYFYFFIFVNQIFFLLFWIQTHLILFPNKLYYANFWNRWISVLSSWLTHRVKYKSRIFLCNFVNSLPETSLKATIWTPRWVFGTKIYLI